MKSVGTKQIRRSSTRQLLAAGLMAMGLPLALLITAGTASASVPRSPAHHAPALARPALSGFSLDNTDPKATGCWDSRAYVTATAKIYDRFGDDIGYVDNYYSPDCGTNWSVTSTGSSDYFATITVWTTRSSYSTDRYTAYTWYAWSNQVYAPTTTACAWGSIKISSSIVGTNQACF